MKNKSLKVLLSLTIMSCLAFTACGHEHTFSEATCTTPKTCTDCGETEGEALGHTWVDATCENAKTCSVCNTTDGAPLNHSWLEATYDAPKTCEICGATEGEPLVTPEEPVVNTGVDSAGSDAEFTEEDEYVEPTTNGDINSQLDALEDLYRQKYENGEIDEEYYQDMLDAIEKERNTQKPQQPSTPPTVHVDVPGVSEDTGDGGGRGNVDDVDLPDYLKGSHIN